MMKYCCWVFVFWVGVMVVGVSVLLLLLLVVWFVGLMDVLVLGLLLCVVDGVDSVVMEDVGLLLFDYVVCVVW